VGSGSSASNKGEKRGVRNGSQLASGHSHLSQHRQEASSERKKKAALLNTVKRMGLRAQSVDGQIAASGVSRSAVTPGKYGEEDGDRFEKGGKFWGTDIPEPIDVENC